MVGMAFIEKMLDLDKDSGRYFVRTCVRPPLSKSTCRIR